MSTWRVELSRLKVLEKRLREMLDSLSSGSGSGMYAACFEGFILSSHQSRIVQKNDCPLYL